MLFRSTDIDYQKKTYSVITFAEMTQAMQAAMQRLKSGRETEGAQVDFKVSVKDTGQTKQIAGLQAKEMIFTLEMEGIDQKTGQKGTMVVTSDMWLAPKVPGYDEVRDFYQKMARKLNWTPGGGGMMGAQPEFARGMAGIYKEASKLDGVPVLQIVKMTPKVEGLPEGQQTAAAGSPPPAKPKAKSEPAPEKPSIGGALGGALGGRLDRKSVV